MTTKTKAARKCSAEDRSLEYRTHYGKKATESDLRETDHCSARSSKYVNSSVVGSTPSAQGSGSGQAILGLSENNLRVVKGRRMRRA